MKRNFRYDLAFALFLTLSILGACANLAPVQDGRGGGGEVAETALVPCAEATPTAPFRTPTPIVPKATATLPIIIEVTPLGGQPTPNSTGGIETFIRGTYTPFATQNIRTCASVTCPVFKLIQALPIPVYRMIVLQPSGDTWLATNATDKYYIAFILGPKVYGTLVFEK